MGYSVKVNKFKVIRQRKDLHPVKIHGKKTISFNVELYMEQFTQSPERNVVVTFIESQIKTISTR